jgi:hypothetical protein
MNYHACTLRNNTFGLDFGRAHAEQLPDSSILITTHWDVYSPLMYLRHIKKWRQDLVLIDKALLRRTWYIKYIANEYPKLYARTRIDVEDYLEELYKFEYDQPYVASIIQMRFLNMLQSFVDAGMHKGVFLSTPWPDQDLENIHPEYRRLPFGLTFIVTADTSMPSFDYAEFQIEKPPVMNDERAEFNLNIARRMLSVNIRYLSASGRPIEAAAARKALEALQ